MSGAVAPCVYLNKDIESINPQGGRNRRTRQPNAPAASLPCSTRAGSASRPLVTSASETREARRRPGYRPRDQPAATPAAGECVPGHQLPRGRRTTACRCGSPPWGRSSARAARGPAAGAPPISYLPAVRLCRGVPQPKLPPVRAGSSAPLVCAAPARPPSRAA